MPRPMPRPPPVTSAVFPSSLPVPPSARRRVSRPRPRRRRPGRSSRCRGPRRTRRSPGHSPRRPWCPCTTARPARASSPARRDRVGRRSRRTRPGRSPRARPDQRADARECRRAGAAPPPINASGGPYAARALRALRCSDAPGPRAARGKAARGLDGLFSCRHLARLFEDVVDRPDHVERLLREVVVLPLDYLAEGADGLGERDVDALEAGELLRHVEGLGEELLDLPGPADDDLVVLGALVHAEDGEDVLQVLVAS